MKKIVSLLLVSMTIFFSHCNQKDSIPVNPDGNNGGNTNGAQNGIHIRGKITGLKKNMDSVSLSDAKKVLVFSKYYYSLTDITADTFSVTAQLGTGVALLFLDSQNKYIGNLSAHGMNMLPLGNLVNGENTTIDLSTLTLVGKSVIPSHDPFGNEIQISETELQSLRTIDCYYESIAKNIDADNDGIPDVLSNKQLVVVTNYAVYGGHWGCNDTLPGLADSSHYFVNYGLEVGGGSDLSFYAGNITLTGPATDPYTDIIRWGFLKAPACGAGRSFIASFARLSNAPPDAPWGTAFLPFKKGTYTLTLDGERSYTLDYSCTDAKYNLILVIPTLHTNGKGWLTSITLEYKLADGTIINPASVMTNVMIQLSDPYSVFFQNDTHKLTGQTGFGVITADAPVDISTLSNIGIGYDDLLGNGYMIVWR